MRADQTSRTGPTLLLHHHNPDRQRRPSEELPSLDRSLQYGIRFLRLHSYGLYPVRYALDQQV